MKNKIEILYSEKNFVIVKHDGLYLCYSYREIIGYIDKSNEPHFKDNLTITSNKHKQKFLKFILENGLTNRDIEFTMAAEEYKGNDWVIENCKLWDFE